VQTCALPISIHPPFAGWCEKWLAKILQFASVFRAFSKNNGQATIYEDFPQVCEVPGQTERKNSGSMPVNPFFYPSQDRESPLAPKKNKPFHPRLNNIEVSYQRDRGLQKGFFPQSGRAHV